MRVLRKILKAVSFVLGILCLIAALVSTIPFSPSAFFSFFFAGIIFMIAPFVYEAIKKQSHNSKNQCDIKPFSYGNLTDNLIDTDFFDSLPPPKKTFNAEPNETNLSKDDIDFIAGIVFIRCGFDELSCSLKEACDSSLIVMIDGVEYSYTISEAPIAHDGLFSFLQKLIINDGPLYLYYREVPSQMYTLGYELYYTKSEKVFQYMKSGGNPRYCEKYLSGLGFLNGSSYSDVQKFIPYIIAAYSKQKMIDGKNGETFLTD